MKKSTFLVILCICLVVLAQLAGTLIWKQLPLGLALKVICIVLAFVCAFKANKIYRIENSLATENSAQIRLKRRLLYLAVTGGAIIALITIMFAMY